MVDADEFEVDVSVDEVDVSVDDEENVDVEEIKFGATELCISEGVKVVVVVVVEVSERGVNAAMKKRSEVSGERKKKCRIRKKTTLFWRSTLWCCS
jgi:hypothetical protein